ncbi:MAG: GSU2403 family nucleotidyltransferase fold protein [Candidatus Omnitrophota bacterium]|nr:GSU2403 family nucleotidyltransferase fold protein [Candidatus Omnitrophota bacterium]
MNLEKIEAVFFGVLEDISGYLPDLTLVGGWMPYIYSNYLWKTSVRNPVTTVDIDFGVDQSVTGDYSKTIFETLSSLDYKERHFKMDRPFPVVLYKEKVPVEFITYPTVDIKAIEKMVGQQIQINKIDKFDFLLKHRISINVQGKQKNKSYLINCPSPSAFLYHKGATFIYRENKEKQAKDLYYMYFILRYAPDVDLILKEVSQYREKGYLMGVLDNMDKFFERVSSQGCLLIEQENGPDEYLHDVRQDIFDRFKMLKEALQRIVA